MLIFTFSGVRIHFSKFYLRKTNRETIKENTDRYGHVKI